MYRGKKKNSSFLSAHDGTEKKQLSSLKYAVLGKGVGSVDIYCIYDLCNQGRCYLFFSRNSWYVLEGQWPSFLC